MQKIESNAKYLGKAVTNRPQVVIKNNHGVVTGDGAHFDNVKFIQSKNHASVALKVGFIALILHVLFIYLASLMNQHGVFEAALILNVAAIMMYLPMGACTIYAAYSYRQHTGKSIWKW